MSNYTVLPHDTPQSISRRFGIPWETIMAHPNNQPVRERFDEQGSFDLATRTMLVPKGQKAEFTPLIAASIPISDTASRGLVPTDKNNFAPRIGFAYKATNRFVVRGGYGIFYGGYETGPWSNPSPGFNPPFFVTESFNQPCGASSANPAAGQTDCSIPGLANLPIPSDSTLKPVPPTAVITVPSTITSATSIPTGSTTVPTTGVFVTPAPVTVPSGVSLSPTPLTVTTGSVR